MPIDPRNAPDRDLVQAYTLCFGDEAGKAVLRDIETFVRGNMAPQKDKLGRIDPFQEVYQSGARRVLERIQAMSGMGKDPNWVKIDRARQLVDAESKL